MRSLGLALSSYLIKEVIFSLIIFLFDRQIDFISPTFPIIILLLGYIALF